MLVQHQLGLLLFLVVILLIALSNLRLLRRLGDNRRPEILPRVSVLVPARNEQDNINSCVRSLLAQEYPSFQVMVLDDDSMDDTRSLLNALAAEDSRLRVLESKTLPRDWIGKSWACHQLAQASDGELLLFTDADTYHDACTLNDAVAALVAEEADLITALPQEEVVSWAERLVIPFVFFSILSFLPLSLAYKLRTPFLSATIGQFMLFRREAYEQIGGHAAVRGHAADDLALGRRIKAHGLCWRLVDGRMHIRCRMYENLHQVYDGLSKNLFAAFDYNLPLFSFIWLWLTTVFLGPLLVIGLGTTAVPISGLSLALASASVAASLLIWGVSHWRFGFPLYLTFLYPLTMLLTFGIAISSIARTLTGRTVWKGRKLIRHDVKWSVIQRTER